MRHLVLGASILLSACGPSGRGGNGGNGGADASVNGNADAPPVFETSRVYAHSGNTLYQLDTATLSPITIGTMTGLGTQSLTDLAIDKNDAMIGITLDKLYSISGSNGAATLIKELSAADAKNLTSLSFIPEDLNDPNSGDILVSANSFGEVFQIDPVTGDPTLLGDFGMDGGEQISSSGDLIGVRGFGIYATVNVGTSPSSQDYLARIDPTDWHATIIGSGTGFNDIFGLAYWQGQIYGFVSMGAGAGKIVTINPTTGIGTDVQTGSVRWYGAGVATDAPIIQ